MTEEMAPSVMEETPTARNIGVAEAARRMGVGRSAFYTQLLSPGRIRSFRIGTRRLIPLSEIERVTQELLDESRNDSRSERRSPESA